jgi:hypothetical protein
MKSPGSHHGRNAECGEGAPLRQMAEQQDKNEHALRRGADSQEDFRGRRVSAHEDRAQRVCGGERENGAEKGRKEGHRMVIFPRAEAPL